jgi:hypothetical protein
LSCLSDGYFTLATDPPSTKINQVSQVSYVFLDLTYASSLYAKLYPLFLLRSRIMGLQYGKHLRLHDKGSDSISFRMAAAFLPTGQSSARKIPLTLALSHNGEREFWGTAYEDFLCFECFSGTLSIYLPSLVADPSCGDGRGIRGG